MGLAGCDKPSHADRTTLRRAAGASGRFPPDRRRCGRRPRPERCVALLYGIKIHSAVRGPLLRSRDPVFGRARRTFLRSITIGSPSRPAVCWTYSASAAEAFLSPWSRWAIINGAFRRLIRCIRHRLSAPPDTPKTIGPLSRRQSSPSLLRICSTSGKTEFVNMNGRIII